LRLWGGRGIHSVASRLANCPIALGIRRGTFLNSRASDRRRFHHITPPCFAASLDYLDVNWRLIDTTRGVGMVEEARLEELDAGLTP
jgi:hypothetical protein